MWFLNATTCFAPSTLLAVTSVADKDVLNTVGSLLPSTTISLSLPSKLNFSKEYLLALVLPLSLLVHVSDTTAFAEWSAAVVLLAARVTPVKLVADLPVYVNCSESINKVPLYENEVVDLTVIVPEPVIPVAEAILVVKMVDAELNILVPLAAIT